LLALHANELKSASKQFYEWTQKCVASQDYFEEY
jgi:hypothetical protein